MVRIFTIVILSFVLLLGLNVSEEETCIIGFGDSGLGGLLFAYDVYMDTHEQLVDLERRYKVDIEFRHIGDSFNAPYGLKTPEKIRELTHGLVQYMVSDLDSDYAIMACNTASSVMDDNFMKTVEQTYGKFPLSPILLESATALYNQAEVVVDAKTGEKHLYIAILSTVATETSGVYPKLLRALHENNPDGRDIELHIVTYAPKYWVNILEEKGVVSELDTLVQDDLALMRQSYPDLDKVSAVGLFCTHFALVEDSIEAYFSQQFNTRPVVLSQGSLFSNNVIRFVESYIEDRAISKRWVPNFAKVEISSFVTGDNAHVIENVMLRIDPALDKALNVTSGVL